MNVLTNRFLSVCLFLSIIPVWHCSHFLKGIGDHCYGSHSEESCTISVEKRYLLYDVNPPEGFNLRRDVFMRIAVLTKKLQKFGNWTLVLPPWTSLYHWKSTDVGDQFNIPWGKFFDVKSIEKFVPVIEFHDFMQDEKNHVIDIVYVLQHFKNAWENNDWKDKMDVEACQQKLHYWLKDDGLYEGDFWDNSDLVSAKKVLCLSFQGSASFIIPILVGGRKVGKKGWISEPRPDAPRIVMLDRAEVLLHDEFGSAEYWRSRRSMRFASPLIQEGTKFRQQFLNSSDELDDTVSPEDWRDEKPSLGHKDGIKGKEIIFSKGGPYLCLHLRRQDFLWGRSSEVPSLKWAALQVLKHLERLKLSTVFLATDAPDKEVAEFRQYIGPNYNVMQWKPSMAQKRLYKDGGVAIIEQIICRHARYFIGTHESTYSFRIQEEREILGFHPDSTFNRLCGGDVPSTGEESRCERPSRWRIAF
ncbi:GDP-fucose protein O-fucosyltransferase 2 [Ischnura elegans]|uniref:GDP-fucose protein O-fucosyltransferase 2 n=1 Tax=Ischnura elegans TaxID=197161 RepID=UPI001ED8B0E3|nr:GDP-fucose protein O-fucosyltransferase 2 [Ischnura elegans]